MSPIFEIVAVFGDMSCLYESNLGMQVSPVTNCGHLQRSATEPSRKTSTWGITTTRVVGEVRNWISDRRQLFAAQATSFFDVFLFREHTTPYSQAFRKSLNMAGRWREGRHFVKLISKASPLKASAHARHWPWRKMVPRGKLQPPLGRSSSLF